MSIIFQTLGKLNTAQNGLDESPYGGGAPVETALPEQAPRSPFRRALWLAGIVSLSLIFLGFGAVLGIYFLSTNRLIGGVAAFADPVAIKIENPTPPSGGSVQIEPAPVAQSAPRYVSPDPSIETASSHGEEKTVLGLPSMTAGPDDNPIAAKYHAAQPGPTDIAMADKEIDATGAVQGAGGAGLPHTLAPVAEADKVIMRKERVRQAVTDPWSDEQHKAENARRLARQKSERINSLVTKLETALNQGAGNDAQIEALLGKLSREKGRDSAYVAKMKAFWLLKRERFDEAGEILTNLTARDAMDPEVGINLVIIDLHKGNRAQARNRLQTLRKKYPDNTYIADLYRKLQ